MKKLTITRPSRKEEGSTSGAGTGSVSQAPQPEKTDSRSSRNEGGRRNRGRYDSKPQPSSTTVTITRGQRDDMDKKQEQVHEYESKPQRKEQMRAYESKPTTTTSSSSKREDGNREPMRSYESKPSPSSSRKGEMHSYESKPSRKEPMHSYESKPSSRKDSTRSYDSKPSSKREDNSSYETRHSYESQPSRKEPRKERYYGKRASEGSSFTRKREPISLEPSGDPDVGILVVKGMPYRCHVIKSTNARVVSSRYLENIKRTEEGISSECVPGGCESPVNMSDDDDDERGTSSNNGGEMRENNAEMECYSYEIKDVPSKLIEFIMSSQKEIESETKSKLIFEKGSKDTNTIVIQSYDTQDCVKNAYDRIMLISMRSRSRVDFTHFVNIPLNSKDSEFNRRLDSFHTAVRSKHYPGLDDSILVKGAQMHLTVQMLRLLSESEVAKASRIMSKCAANLVTRDMSGRTLHLKGLEYMNDDPSAVDVLYAKVCDFPSCIHELCKGIVREFMSAGLVSEDEVRSEGEGESLEVKFKFHATIINTRFRKGEDQSQSEGRVPFDARQLLKDFENFDFGTVKIESIHLSQRAISPSTGFFKCLNFIQLNESI